jgi:hypothetical protein
MKGDNTRNTFDPAKHYRDVLLQQGRVQVDADWNEQAELTARRDETTTADIIGDCGGPADYAAFGIFTETVIPSFPVANPPDLPVADNARAQQTPDFVLPPRPVIDFFLSAGRYYVDGIQCENESAVLYTAQPDRLDVARLVKDKSYLLYLDVWHRHITALEDGLIRESALGGPDTGTRVKTVWQVRALELGPGVVDPDNPCGSGADAFHDLFDPGTAMLTADTAKVQAPKDPCLVPAGAGFTGLENQLYRVEIHDGGTALDAASNVSGTGLVTLPSGNTPKNQITVDSGSWAVGNTVEIYPSKTGSPVMKGQLARIITVSNPNNRVLTLNIPVSGFVDTDLPLLRKISGATWKWSRENGSVVTRVEKIDGSKITVSSLGPDKNLGFTKDAWVEILDDALELESKPGQLAQIDDVDEASRIITLKSAASSLVPAGFPPANYPNGVVPARHPKLRRWEGVAAVKFVADPNTNWLPLESGVQVRFANGSYLTGHFWQIPARTATAQSPGGEIEWPVDKSNRLALAPRGITHHFCRLGIVTVNDDNSIDSTDCRCLWPALTTVPRLFYVSGDGQEVMPEPISPINVYKLPQPLIAGVANPHCLKYGPLAVRFKVTLGSGRVTTKGGNAAAASGSIDITTDAKGLAICDFHPDGTNYTQRVTAMLLDENGNPVSLPLIFNANLSIASQVAYDPTGCTALQGKRTVQAAIARLASLTRLEAVGGDGQDIEPGSFLVKPIRVLVTSSCGPVAGATVRFDTGGNQGLVTHPPPHQPPPAPTCDVVTLQDGIATCLWKLDPNPAFPTQELTVTLVPPDTSAQPGTLRFTANLRLHGCCVTVGKDGEFPDLATTIDQLINRDFKEICICLLPGDHEVFDLVIDGNTILDRVHIHGCGRASRLLVRDRFEARALSSIHLQDLCIFVDKAQNRPIYLRDCDDVTITGCHVRNQDTDNRAPADLLIIHHQTGSEQPPRRRRTSIANNVIECEGSISGIIINPRFVAPAEGLPADAQMAVENAVSNLATKSKSQRTAFVKKFRKIVKETPKSDPNKQAMEAALKRLAATPRSAKASKAAAPIREAGDATITPALPPATTPEALAAILILPGPLPGPLPTRTIFGPALVIADADAELMIVNNIIKGEVRLYGIQKRFEQVAFIHLANEIRDLEIKWDPTQNDAKIEGNSLTEITVDEEAEPVLVHHHGLLSGIFNRLSILNNTFSSSFPQNQWLAANVISNGNHFVPGARDLGIVVGTSLICIGTSADYNPNGGDDGQPAAYLQYSISPDRARFRESANLISLAQLGQIPP